MIWRKDDSTARRLHTAPHPTGFRLPALMHDTVDPLDVVWQNSGHDQVPSSGSGMIRTRGSGRPGSATTWARSDRG
nr:hypothetical protein C5F59_31035 [Streptomyces sp. QL37]